MEKDPLDILFNKRSSTDSSYQGGEDDHWDEFEIRLHKKMFYKFSWNRFNIYYVSLIGMSAFINIIFLATFISRTNQTISIKQDQQFYTDTNTFKTEQPTGISKEKNNSSTNFPVKHSSQSNKIDSITTASLEQSKDTTHNVSIEKTVIAPIAASPNPIIIKRKSTMYISKRDTLINIDTIKVKRKK